MKKCCDMTLVILLLAIALVFFSAIAEASSASSPTPLTPGTPVTDILAVDGQTNYYTFTLNSLSTVSLDLQHASNGSGSSYWQASILSQDQLTTFVYLDSAGTATDTAVPVMLPAGSYLVKVTNGAYGYTDTGTSYQLTVNAQAGSNLETESNNTPATATPITPGTLYTGVIASLSYSNDVDYYKFSIGSASDVTLDFKHASNGSGSSYWQAIVQSSDGQASFLYLNSNGTDLDNSAHVFLPAGSYLVKVLNGAYGYTDSRTSYQISVSAQAGTNLEVEKNGTPATATPITPGTTYTGIISELPDGSDLDYYTFTLGSMSDLTVHLQHASNGSSSSFWQATVLSSDGQTSYLYLDSAGNATDTSGRVFLPAGTYLVKVVNGDTGSTDTKTAYQLSVSAQAGSNFEIEKNDNAGTATPMVLETAYTGIIAALPSSTDQDFYSFTVSISRPYLVRFQHPATGSSSSVWNVKVVDGSNNQYLSLDVPGDATDLSYGTTALTAGVTYYVKVTDYSFYWRSLGVPYQVTVLPDRVPPVSSASVPGGTYRVTKSVTLSCSDGTQVGCDKTYYTTDGSLPSASSPVYSGAISIPANATTVLKYFSTDLAGNAEAVKSQTYVIDTLVPTTSCSLPGGAFNTAQSVTLSCSDGSTGTGCDKIYYTTNGATPTLSSSVYSGALGIQATTTLKYFATDVAGNSEPVKTQNYVIDAIPPATAAPKGGALYGDSVVWTAQTPDNLMSGQNGVTFVGANIVTVGGIAYYYDQPNIVTGYIASTSDGKTWSEVMDHSPDGYSESYYDALYNIYPYYGDGYYGVTAPGAPFVVVGGKGHIISGTDYNYRDSKTGADLYAVAWSDALAKLFAVGSGGVMVVSPDGTTWSTAVSGTSQTLFGIASSPARLVAVGANGTIVTSTDGAAWTKATSGTTQSLYGVAWSPAVSDFVAVGSSGTVLTSPDGIAWTLQDSRSFETLNAVASSGSQVVAVGSGGTILASLNGVVWRQQNSGTTSSLEGIAWSGSQFAVAGYGGTLLLGAEATPAPLGAASIVLACSDSGGAGCDKTYYTTDGSTPTTASAVYGGPIALSGSATLKFFSTDRAGNLEAVRTEQYLLGGSADTTRPTVTQFGIPSTALGLTVAVSFVATDDSAVARYCLTESSDPASCGANWSPTAPIQYSFAGYGSHTLYGFAADPSWNISAAASAGTVLTQPPAQTLSVTLAGTGGGSVNSNPAGIGCASGTCSASYPYGSSVTLMPSPSAGSQFAGWSGGCTGTGACSPTLTSGVSVTATFNVIPNVRLGSVSYGMLQPAVDAATTGASVLAQGVSLSGGLTLSQDKSVTLKGGFDPGFTTQGGFTVLHGGLTIEKGTLRVDRLRIGN